MSPSRLARAQRDDQRQADQVAAAELRGVHRLLQVQQAEVVLAALADHRLAAPAPPDRDRRRGSRARSAAAGRGCRSRPTPPGRWPRPTARRARDSPGSCRRRCRPRPASAAARPRARAGWKAKAVSAAKAAWAGPRLVEPGAVEQLRQPRAAAPPGRSAWSRPRPAAPGPPIPAAATRPPGRSRARAVRSGCGAQRADRRRAPRPSRRGPGSRRPPAPPRGWARALGELGQQQRGRPRAAPPPARPRPCGSGRPSASARPAAEGAQNARRPHEGEQLQRVEDAAPSAAAACSSSRRAVRPAWATSTGPASNRSRASRRPHAARRRRRRQSAARGPGSTTRAGARSRTRREGVHAPRDTPTRRKQKGNSWPRGRSNPGNP